MNNCDVVIVNHNAGEALVQAVRSVLVSKVGQVVVVDNASTDGSIHWLKTTFAGEDKIRVIEAGANLGFAGGCNLGSRELAGDAVLFLNPDCVVEADAIEKMLGSLAEQPRVGMVGPLLLNPDRTEQRAGRRAVPYPWQSFLQAFGLKRRSWAPIPAGPVSVDVISGACMLVRSSATKEVGGFDEGYFLHCEDIDWCMRFREKGWDIVFVPQATVVHYKGTCS